jgi:hypothetical protein
MGEMPLPRYPFALDNFVAQQLLEVPLQSFPPTTAMSTESDQLTPFPIEVYQMQVQASVATPQRSPTTASMTAPRSFLHAGFFGPPKEGANLQQQL